MSWNEVRYMEGYRIADETLQARGLEAAEKEYASLDGARAVDEFEVGYRTRLKLERERISAE